MSLGIECGIGTAECGKSKTKHETLKTKPEIRYS
jgi:hypothetical protein